MGLILVNLATLVTITACDLLDISDTTNRYLLYRSYSVVLMKLSGLQFPKSVFVLLMKGYRFLKRKPVFPSEILKVLRKTTLYLLNIEKMI